MRDMKKYYFIGSESDLISEGFDLISGPAVLAIKRTNNGNVFIERGSLLILSFSAAEIEDLVNKGLARSEEETED